MQTKTRSPVAWPWVSLTALKRSMSSISTAIWLGLRSSKRLIAWLKPRRFITPVRASCSAICCMAATRRSVISSQKLKAMPTAPAMATSNPATLALIRMGSVCTVVITSTISSPARPNNPTPIKNSDNRQGSSTKRRIRSRAFHNTHAQAKASPPSNVAVNAAAAGNPGSSTASRVTSVMLVTKAMVSGDRRFFCPKKRRTPAKITICPASNSPLPKIWRTTCQPSGKGVSKAIKVSAEAIRAWPRVQ